VNWNCFPEFLREKTCSFYTKIKLTDMHFDKSRENFSFIGYKKGNQIDNWIHDSIFKLEKLKIKRIWTHVHWKAYQKNILNSLQKLIQIVSLIKKTAIYWLFLFSTKLCLQIFDLPKQISTLSLSKELKLSQNIKWFVNKELLNVYLKTNI
jgi:hypothetical protein